MEECVQVIYKYSAFYIRDLSIWTLVAVEGGVLEGYFLSILRDKCMVLNIRGKSGYPCLIPKFRGLFTEYDVNCGLFICGYYLLLFFSHSVMSDSCNPVNASPPGSFVYGIFWARLLGWVAISSSMESSQPRD